MGQFSEYPYLNFADKNIDFIINKIKEFQGTLDEFIQNHPAISYADPMNWNISLQYSANKVVIGPDKDSYLSLKVVPAGILLTNTEYWLKIGLFNAQLQGVDDRLAALETNYKKRTFLLFGDSLFDGYDPDSATRHGWGYWLDTWLSARGYIVHRASDITATPYGSAFAGSKTYLMHLQETLTTHPEYANENITDVIVYTGSNDSTHSTSDTETGISQFVTGIKAIWPYANIKIGFFSALTSLAARSVDELFRNVCGKYGCSYIKNGFGMATDKTKISTDGTHLKTAGYEYYSPYLCEAALSGILKYTFSFKDIPIVPSGVLTFTNIGINLTIKDGILYVRLSNIGGNFGVVTYTGLSGSNPADIACSFTNPTSIDFSIIPGCELQDIPTYDENTGNMLGVIKPFFGSFPNPNYGNIPMRILGSISPGKGNVYSANYTVIPLD